MTIAFRYASQENNKYYSENCLHECVYEFVSEL